MFSYLQRKFLASRSALVLVAATLVLSLQSWGSETTPSSVSATAAPAPWYAFPKLSTLEEKLSYLLWVSEQLPGMFTSANLYQVDLLKLLESQDALQQQLRLNKKFQEKWKARPTPVQILIKPKKEVQIQVRGPLEKNQIRAWHEYLRQSWEELFGKRALVPQQEFLTKVEVLAQSPLTKIRIHAIIAALQQEQLQPEQRQKFSSLKGEERLQYLKKSLRLSDPLSSRIRTEQLGLPKNTTVEEVFSLLDQALAHQRVLPAMGQLVTLQSKLTEDMEGKPHFSLDKISTLNQSELEFVADKVDVLEPTLKKYGLVELTHADSSTRLRKAPTMTANLKTLRLVELPPGVAIYRSFLMGNCSSEYSFPYPNDPNERVFAVFDEEGHVKGAYVVTDVESQPSTPNAKALYGITIQGPDISGEDTITALHGLDLAKEKFKATETILPTLDSIHGLIESESIRDILRRPEIRGAARNIIYDMESGRATIESHPYNNHGSYDHASSNTEGNQFVPIPKIKSSLTVEVTTPSYTPFVPKKVTKTDAYIFSLTLLHSGQGELIESLRPITGISAGTLWKHNKNIFLNPVMYRTADFEEVIRKEMRELGIDPEALLTREDLLYEGIVHAVDAWEEPHIKRTRRLVIKDVKMALNETEFEPKIGTDLVREKAAHIFTDANFWDPLKNVLTGSSYQDRENGLETLKTLHGTKIPIPDTVWNLVESEALSYFISGGDKPPHYEKILKLFEIRWHDRMNEQFQWVTESSDPLAVAHRGFLGRVLNDNAKIKKLTPSEGIVAYDDDKRVTFDLDKLNSTLKAKFFEYAFSGKNPEFKVVTEAHVLAYLDSRYDNTSSIQDYFDKLSAERWRWIFDSEDLFAKKLRNAFLKSTKRSRSSELEWRFAKGFASIAQPETNPQDAQVLAKIVLNATSTLGVPTELGTSYRTDYLQPLLNHEHVRDFISRSRNPEGVNSRKNIEYVLKNPEREPKLFLMLAQQYSKDYLRGQARPEWTDIILNGIETIAANPKHISLMNSDALGIGIYSELRAEKWKALLEKQILSEEHSSIHIDPQSPAALKHLVALDASVPEAPELERQARARAVIDLMISAIGSRDRKTALLFFPKHPSHIGAIFVPVKNEPEKWKSAHESQAWLADIFNLLQEGKPLSSEQNQLLDILINVHDWRLNSQLLLVSPEVRERVLTSLTHADEDALFRVLTFLEKPPLNASGKESHQILTHELKQNTAFRNHLKKMFQSRMETGIFPASLWKFYPWDLNDAKDIEILRNASEATVNADEKLLDFRRTEFLRVDYEGDFSPKDVQNFFEFNAQEIKNPKLRESALKVELHWRLADSHLKEVFEIFPESQLKKKLPDIWDSFRRANIRRELVNYPGMSSSVGKRFHLQGWRGLNSQEARALHDLLKEPMSKGLHRFYSWMKQTKDAHTDMMKAFEKRFDYPIPADHFDEYVQLMKSNWEFMERWDTDKSFRARVRDLIESNIKDGKEIHLQGHGMRWDLSDPDEFLWFDRLNREIPQDPKDYAQKVTAEVAKEMAARGYHFETHWSPIMLPDPVLREKYRRAQTATRDRNQFRTGLIDATQGFPALRAYFDLNRQAIHFEPEAFQVSAKHNKITVTSPQSLHDLFADINNATKIASSRWASLLDYAYAGHADAIKLALIRPETRAAVSNVLLTTGTAANKTLPTLLLGGDRLLDKQAQPFLLKVVQAAKLKNSPSSIQNKNALNTWGLRCSRLIKRLLKLDQLFPE